MIGIVYYKDDPLKRVFRTVHLAPGEPDSLLDDPRWVTEGIAGREAVLDRIDEDDLSSHPRGTPWTPADEPYPAPLNPYRAEPSVIRAGLDIAGVGNGDVLIDLGCGAGDWLIAANQRGARAIGIEIDSRLCAMAREQAVRRNSVIEVLEADYHTADLSEATVVVANLGGSLPADILRRVSKRARVVIVDAPRNMPGEDRSVRVDHHLVSLWRA